MAHPLLACRVLPFWRDITIEHIGFGLFRPLPSEIFCKPILPIRGDRGWPVPVFLSLNIEDFPHAFRCISAYCETEKYRFLFPGIPGRRRFFLPVLESSQCEREP